MLRAARFAGVLATVASSLVALAARAELPAHAPQTSPAARRVSLSEAMRLGATRGPDVAVASAPRAAANEAKRAADAVLTTLPRVAVMAGDRIGPRGVNGVEIGVSVTQDVPIAGTRGARRDAAAAYGRVVDLDLARARLEGGARAALAWIALAEADSVLAYRHASLEQAEAIAKTLRARVTKGVADPVELPLAMGDVATARAGVLEAEGMRFEAALELRFAIGEAADTALAIAGSLDTIVDAAGDEAALVRRAEQGHPLVLLAEARGEAARREADLSVATSVPALGVGASYTREGSGDQVVTGTISVPLPFSRPWAFEASRQRAAADVARAQATRARAELGREIRTALHERDHTRELHDTLVHEALTPMKEALRLARVQFDAGAIDVTRVLLARQRLVATEEQAARALAQVRRADVRLMRAAGTLLEGIGP
ncbi:Heavy metal RND efflux outer membrane protein, CzcC family protein [Minicystis rosea]|nr:Heavy metal RND efflux outer membrane protein, CzcC family protein [Minicystis rosea]